MPHRPAHHRRNTPGLPRGRGRHYRDQQLQCQRHIDGRLSARRGRARNQPRRRPSGPPSGRRLLDCRETALRSGVGRTYEQELLHVARRGESRPAQPPFRHPCRSLSRTDGGARRGRRRPAARRDHLRHPQCQSHPVGRPPGHGVGGSRGARGALGHRYRKRPHPLGANPRGVPHLGIARLPAGRGDSTARSGPAT